MFNIGDRVKYVGNSIGRAVSTIFLGKVGTVIYSPRGSSNGVTVEVRWDGSEGSDTTWMHNLQLISGEKKQMNEIDTNTIEGKIAVMQAFKEGKAIEFRVHGYSASWRPVDQNPVWNWERYDYRIKKEPEVRWIIRHSDGTLNVSAFSDEQKRMCDTTHRYDWVKFVEAEDQE